MPLPQTSLGFWTLGQYNLSGSRVAWVTAVMEHMLEPTVWQPGSLLYRLVDAIAQEIGLAYDALDFAQNEAFAATASATLPERESLYSTPTDLTQTLLNRQQAVLAAMRAGASPTLPAYRTIAEAFEDGVIHPVVDPLAFELYIYFASVLGVPANLAAFQAAINLETAGRLGINYVYLYLIYFQLSAWGATPHTYTQLNALGLTYAQLLVEPAGSL